MLCEKHFRNRLQLPARGYDQCEIGSNTRVTSMTEPRPETRVATDLNLRVWGIDADGHAFFQQAHARNISTRGALLSGIEHHLKIGETIGLQYGEKKTRCEVVWALNTGSLHKIQAGVKLLSDMACPWTAELLTMKKLAALSPQSVRKWNRHRISFVVELYDPRASTAVRVTATDISANGCYVETIVPLPVGTSLKVDLRFLSEKITTRSLVRTSDPGVGMGIEFLCLKTEERQRFQGHLEALDPWSSSIAR
jgi:PilZ domain